MAGKSPASHQSIASGKTAPTLIPIGKFAGKPEVSLSRTVTLIGSGAQSRLQLISSTVSKSHALIINCARGAYVRDLASRTKVLVNGEEAREAVLHTGDSVQFGKFAFTFNEAPGRESMDEDDRRMPPAPAQAALEVTGVETPIPLNERCLLIGRRETCDIVISDEAVSTAHSVIFEMDGQRYIRDLGSRTGTFVNGKQVHQSDLSFGDTVRIGSIDLKYMPVEVPVEETAGEEVDELDHLVRTDNLGTDVLEAEAAADLASAQERAAARSMPKEAPQEEPEPIEVEAGHQSLDVIPLDDIGVEEGQTQDEVAQAASAPLPKEVEALQELTVDDLMEGSQSLDDIPPVTEDVGVPHEAEVEVEPELEPLPVDEGPVEHEPVEHEPVEHEPVEHEPVEREPVELQSESRNGDEVAEAALSLGEAGPLEIAPPIDLSAPASRFAEAPVEDEAAELAETGREEPSALPEADLDDVLGLAPERREPEPSVPEVEAEPLEVEPEAEALPVEPEAAAEVPAQEVAAPGVEPIPVEDQRDAIGVAPVEEAPAEQEPVEEEPVAEEPAIAAEPEVKEPVEEPLPIAESEEEEPVEEEEPEPIQTAPAPATPPAPAPVVAPVFEQEEEVEEEEYEEEDEEMELADSEESARLELQVPPAPAPVRSAPVAPVSSALPLDAEVPELDFSAPIEDVTLAGAGALDELPLNLDLGATPDMTLPGLEDIGPEELKLDLPLEEPAGAGLQFAPPVGEAPLPEPVKPKKRLGRKKKVQEPPAPAAPVAPVPAAAPEIAPAIPPAPVGAPEAEKPIEPEPAPEPIAEVPLVSGPIEPSASEPVAEAPLSVPLDDVLTGPSAPSLPEEVIAPLAEVPLSEETPAEETPAPIGLADAQVDRGPVEVIEQSEPASAMEIGEELDAVDVAPAPEASAIEEAAALTDTRFGRAVEEFSGEASTGPLIEEPREVEARAEEAPVEEAPKPQTEESIAELLGEGPTDEAPLAEDDPMAGFASFNTLARELDLSEPSVEGLPALEPGLDEKFVAHAHKTQAEHPPAPDAPLEVETSLEDVLNEALGKIEPAAKAEPLPVAEPDVDALADLEVEAVPEPVAEAPEPVAEAPQSITPAPQPVAEAPKMEPPQAPQPPAKPRFSPADLNWGANQEHFLGGLPLSLGNLSPAAPTTPPLVARAPGAERPASPVEQPGEQPTAVPEDDGAAPIPPPTPQPPAPRAGAPAQPTAPKRVPLIQPSPRVQRPVQKPRSVGGMGLVNPQQQKGPPRQVSTGFDGLAMTPPGPPRQVDVFSQMPGGIGRGAAPDPFAGSAGAADDVLTGRATRGPRQQAGGPQQPPRSRTVRGAAEGEPGGAAWHGEQAPTPIEPQAADSNDALAADAPAPAEPPPEPPKKKRRWFGLRIILLFMILSLGATAAGVWFLMPPESLIVGTLKFTDNFKTMPELEKRKLERQQQELLFDEQVRKDARGLLTGIKREANAGFLENPIEFAKVVQAAKFDLDLGTFTVNYVGTDAANDPSRMQALLRALYNGNRSSVSETRKMREEVESLERARGSKQKEVQAYEQQMAKYQLAAEGRPDAAEQTRLESEATRLEGEYRDSVQAVAKLQGEVEKLSGHQSTTAPAGAVAASGPTFAASAPAVDPTLAQYEAELRKLNQRVATVRELRTQKAMQARKALDDAADAFQKQIEQAQSAIKDNPELAKYFTSARELQNSMRDLTEQYLRRQQDQYAKLSDLKARMDEKMTARRDDAMKNDPKMKEYLDQKDIKTRQYNAAVASGYNKEAGELKADLDLLEQMIKARQTQLGDDAFYADAIEQVQKLIDSTQRGIEDDKRETSKVLEQLQLAFAKQQPSKDALPADQKKLTGELEKKLASLAEARKQYTDAAELASAQADEEIRQMEANATALADKIKARRREIGADGNDDFAFLSDAERAKLLRQKQEQLAKALAVKDLATATHQSAQAKLADLRTRLNAAREAGDKRDELTRALDHSKKELDQLDDQLTLKSRLLKSRAEPIAPTAGDVDVRPLADKRRTYLLASLGGVVLVFASLILVSLVGGGGDRAPVLPMPVQEYAGEPFFAPPQELKEPVAENADENEYAAMEVEEPENLPEPSEDAYDFDPEEHGGPATA